MRVARNLNPMRLLSAGSMVQLVKVGAGVYGYKLVSTQVDKKWLRWTIYGGMALFGFYAPLAIAGLNEIWPEWSNLDRRPPAQAGAGDLARQARAVSQGGNV